MGNQDHPTHFNPAALSWQSAMLCLQDLGINMGSTEPQTPLSLSEQVSELNLIKESSRGKSKPLKAKVDKKKTTGKASITLKQSATVKAASTLQGFPAKSSSQKGTSTPKSQQQAPADVLEPLTRLKYTDLVYLLNILKLQAAKKSDKLS